MEQIQVEAFIRNQSGKGPARTLRRSGQIPAVFYGPETKPISLYVRQMDLEKIFKKHSGENLFFQVRLKGEHQEESRTAMLKELQKDPVSRAYLHVDFYEVSLTKELEVEVGLRLLGRSKGVEKGGILQEARRDLQIRCLPRNIPEYIEVDISGLDIGDSIHVRDLKLIEELQILNDPQTTIVTIVPPIEEKAAEEATAGAAEVEVVSKKGKTKEE
jgi:large subunit ribosomal protein L25